MPVHDVYEGPKVNLEKVEILGRATMMHTRVFGGLVNLKSFIQ